MKAVSNEFSSVLVLARCNRINNCLTSFARFLEKIKEDTDKSLDIHFALLCVLLLIRSTDNYCLCVVCEVFFFYFNRYFFASEHWEEYARDREREKVLTNVSVIDAYLSLRWPRFLLIRLLRYKMTIWWRVSEPIYKLYPYVRQSIDESHLEILQPTYAHVSFRSLSKIVEERNDVWIRYVC